MKKTILGLLAGLLLVPSMGQEAKAGSFEIGVYGGIGESLDSDVEFRNGKDVVSHSDVEWDGEPFGPAPYWGARITYWPDSLPNWGFMLDYTHAKLIAEESSGSSTAGNIGANYNRLEFTDGLNLITANVLYKYNEWKHVKPYIGAGLGLSIPHVEVERGSSNTAEYQITGVAAQVLVGASYEITENISLFGEYKFSYADVDADLNGGGTLETEALTNHVVVGVSYKFDGPQ